MTIRLRGHGADPAEFARQVEATKKNGTTGDRPKAPEQSIALTHIEALLNALVEAAQHGSADGVSAREDAVIDALLELDEAHRRARQLVEVDLGRAQESLRAIRAQVFHGLGGEES